MNGNILYQVTKDNDGGSTCEVALYDNHRTVVRFHPSSGGEMKNKAQRLVEPWIGARIFYKEYANHYQADIMFQTLCRMTSITIDGITPYGFREGR